MSTNELIQQHLRLQRQKEEFLQKNVVHTDPVAGPIHWSMWSQAPDNGFSLGHGVHYHDTLRNPELNVVAFLRGFAWQRTSESQTTRGYYIQPDATTTPEIIAELKKKIESLVAAKERHYYPETYITDRIYARGNC